MLYNLNWLQSGKSYPPMCERERITRYIQNAALFNNNQFSSNKFRNRIESPGVLSDTVGLYDSCVERISKVIGNFSDIISVPVLLNYQRFMSLKLADLVAGEAPLITGKDEKENAKIRWILDNTEFDQKLYSVVIDLSRFGDCPIRVFKDQTTGLYNWITWEATNWLPIVSDDGTYTITHHVLTWMENRADADSLEADYYLHAQIFDVCNPELIDRRVYQCGSDATTIGELVESESGLIETGFDSCPILSVRAVPVSGTIYGYDDYVPIDSIMTEIITRVSQISAILDKHADPAMTGPMTMLNRDPDTGKLFLQSSKFYGVNPEDTQPKYLTWDGQLSAAFKQLDFLINQLYILSELGAALTGGTGESANAVSGSAMRFKLVNPIAKARRVSNSLTQPMKRLISLIGSNMPDIDPETGEPGSGEDTQLPFGHITINWQDGLPNDPSEELAMCKLASGEAKMMPLEDALVQFMGKTRSTAQALADKVREQNLVAEEINKPGIQDGTGVNPTKKSSNSISNFQAETNKKKK